MLAVLLIVLAVTPASALICGDGILDPLLEACDDGNNAPDDCCSPLCQIEPPGTVCRTATGACDPEETCTGDTGACPLDVVLPDLDADGVCDPSDPCVNSDGTVLQKTKLTLAKLDLPIGDDRFRLKGNAVLPAGPAIDPVANGIALRVADGNDVAAVEVVVPGGAFDPGTRTGWRVNANQNVFTFRSGGNDPALEGVQRIIVKTSPTQPRAVKVVAVGRNGMYVRPTEAPVTVAVNLTPAEPGQCAEGQFNAFEGGPRCVFLNNGARFACR